MSMDHSALVSLINKKIALLERLVPEFAAVEADRSVANGNVAVCILDPQGNIYGRLFGENKIRQRESFRIAWIKASQVWITGMKTAKYEEMVFTGQVNERTYGISRPDFIGWEGGQPVTLEDGTILSIGFSGFRGTTDLAIVSKAFER